METVKVKINEEEFVIMSKLELLKHDYAIKEECYKEAREAFETALYTLYQEYHWVIKDEANNVLWLLQHEARYFLDKERGYADAFSKDA